MRVGMVSGRRQRLPTAASAEFGPSGRVKSKEAIGASGRVLKREYVIPRLISVLPLSLIVTPSPCSTISRLGKSSPPCETRYAGPASGWARSGVVAVAMPTSEAGGQVAGSVSNCVAGQARCRVLSREGSAVGS
jgi:hypothetical protein